MTSFNSLVSNYPTQSKSELYHSLDGEWPDLIGNPNYNNTCAVRLSVAFNRSGTAVPGAFREAIDGQGNNIILKVKTMQQFVESRFGTSSWGMSKSPGTAVGEDTLPASQGVIAYHAAWADATGHFDLWTGSGFVGSGSLESIADGFDIELWSL